MEQKQPDLCVVSSLIDGGGPRLLTVRCILSECFLEYRKDKNHSFHHDVTEAERPIQACKLREKLNDGQNMQHEDLKVEVNLLKVDMCHYKILIFSLGQLGNLL